jgi:hypothetical protein
LRRVSTGGIVMIVIAGLVTGVFVPVRIAVAKQRRAVATARARLAASRTVRRRAQGVQVEAIQKLGASTGRVTRTATCALTDDGFYCLSDDGRWGARVRLAPGALQIGDLTLVGEPCLVKGGAVVGKLTDDLGPVLGSLPGDGLLLQLGGGLTWFAPVPDVEEWFAALQSSFGQAAPPT